MVVLIIRYKTSGIEITATGSNYLATILFTSIGQLFTPFDTFLHFWYMSITLQSKNMVSPPCLQPTHNIMSMGAIIYEPCDPATSSVYVRTEGNK